jgi:pimeloyl-[acyl-carrier protein] methyl ester esterase
MDTQGEGRDLVLLHGWGFHSGAWDAVLPLLARRYRVHRIDLPGHGHSSRCRIAGFDEAARAIAERIPARSIVAGWSLGGLFAQRIAAWDAPSIAALALVSSTPCFAARDDWDPGMAPRTLEGFAMDLERATAPTLEQFIRLNALNGARSRETAREAARQLHARPLPGAEALRHGLAWLREVDLRADAARIRKPCVVVHGGRDAITPPAAGRWLAGAIPGAAWVEIEDAAHLPLLSHPERFVQALEVLDE